MSCFKAALFFVQLFGICFLAVHYCRYVKSNYNITMKGNIMRKTKIVCTIGPASADEETLRSLVINGMNVARLNLSHGDHASHKRAIDMIKEFRKEYGKRIAILLDIEGPKIRVRSFKNGEAMLIKGETFTFCAKDCEGDSKRVAVTYPYLAKAVNRGTRILLDDGSIELEVEKTQGGDTVCRVITGGMLKDHKSLNVPGAKLDMDYISDKDRSDILFGIENDVDYIAASFCRTATDILEVRKLLGRHGGNKILVIAKIENQTGVDNIQEIMKVGDGIMVARGDMGVEIDIVEVPRLQRQLIRDAAAEGMTVITATQMLESMINSPRPTRAEVTDVAGAVYEGTSAVMLSGETSVGKYPVESLVMMSRIATRTENDIDYRKRFNSLPPDGGASVTSAVSHAACLAAHSTGTSAILTVTKTGTAARRVSGYRPAVSVIACSPDEKTCNQLAMSWGVYPIFMYEKSSTDTLFEHALERAQSEGLLKPGEAVVIAAGVPVGVSGDTNTIRVQIIGNILIRGKGISGMTVKGRLCVCENSSQLHKKFKQGDIVALPKTEDSMMDILSKASGIIAEEDGSDSHAAIAGFSLGKPVLFGAKGATKILESGMEVTLDTLRGMVYSGISKTEGDGDGES